MKTLNFELSTSNNLLAFSAGIDSSALFFLLLEHDNKKDIITRYIMILLIFYLILLRFNSMFHVKFISPAIIKIIVIC